MSIAVAEPEGRDRRCRLHIICPGVPKMEDARGNETVRRDVQQLQRERRPQTASTWQAGRLDTGTSQFRYAGATPNRSTLDWVCHADAHDGMSASLKLTVSGRRRQCMTSAADTWSYRRSRNTTRAAAFKYRLYKQGRI